MSWWVFMLTIQLMLMLKCRGSPFLPISLHNFEVSNLPWDLLLVPRQRLLPINLRFSDPGHEAPSLTLECIYREASYRFTPCRAHATYYRRMKRFSHYKVCTCTCGVSTEALGGSWGSNLPTSLHRGTRREAWERQRTAEGVGLGAVPPPSASSWPQERVGALIGPPLLSPLLQLLHSSPRAADEVWAVEL